MQATQTTTHEIPLLQHKGIVNTNLLLFLWSLHLTRQPHFLPKPTSCIKQAHEVTLQMKTMRNGEVAMYDLPHLTYTYIVWEPSGWVAMGRVRLPGRWAPLPVISKGYSSIYKRPFVGYIRVFQFFAELTKQPIFCYFESWHPSWAWNILMASMTLPTGFPPRTMWSGCPHVEPCLPTTCAGHGRPHFGAHWRWSCIWLGSEPVTGSVCVMTSGNKSPGFPTKPIWFQQFGQTKRRLLKNIREAQEALRFSTWTCL